MSADIIWTSIAQFYIE